MTRIAPIPRIGTFAHGTYGDQWIRDDREKARLADVADAEARAMVHLHSLKQPREFTWGDAAGWGAVGVFIILFLTVMHGLFQWAVSFGGGM